MDTKYMDNAPSWSDVRVVEGARLEIWCGARPHLGFESLSLRKKQASRFRGACFFVILWDSKLRGMRTHVSEA